MGLPFYHGVFAYFTAFFCGKSLCALLRGCFPLAPLFFTGHYAQDKKSRRESEFGHLFSQPPRPSSREGFHNIVIAAQQGKHRHRKEEVTLRSAPEVKEGVKRSILACPPLGTERKLFAAQKGRVPSIGLVVTRVFLASAGGASSLQFF